MFAYLKKSVLKSGQSQAARRAQMVPARCLQTEPRQSLPLPTPGPLQAPPWLTVAPIVGRSPGPGVLHPVRGSTLWVSSKLPTLQASRALNYGKGSFSGETTASRCWKQFWDLALYHRFSCSRLLHFFGQVSGSSTGAFRDMVCRPGLCLFFSLH